jgi:signal transduction histidine kinase
MSMFKNKRLFIVFLLVVVLPGVALIVLGVRTLRQEKAAADQELHEWLSLVSEKIEQNIHSELGWWLDGVSNLSSVSEVNPENLPPRFHSTLAGQNGSMLIRLSDDRVETIPGNALLYSLEESFAALESQTSSKLSRIPANLSTSGQQDASAASRPQTRSSPDTLKVRSLFDKGRALSRERRMQEAISAYEGMKQYTLEKIGNVPADLIADFEICSLYSENNGAEALRKNSLSFFSDLVRGRWLLEKPRYQFYAAKAKEWLHPAEENGETHRLISLENRKLEMTGIVEKLLPSIDSLLQNGNSYQGIFQTAEGVGFAFLSKSAGENSVAILLLSPVDAANRIWPAIFSFGDAEKCSISLTTPGGIPLYSSGVTQNSGPPDVQRLIKVDGGSWALDVGSGESNQFHADLQRKQVIYISIFILFLVSLGFAVYVGARTLHQEIEVARMKTHFVSIVSHEFRTPLTGIRHLAEMLIAGRAAGDQKRMHYYSMILRESDQLARMVENILAFARGTEKRKPYTMEPIDTNRWLRETVSQFQQSVVGSRIDLIFNASGSLPGITGDPAALSLVLANLIENAIKYSPNNAAVGIEAEEKDGWVHVRVRDNGIGISDRDLKKIFERFYRGRDAAVRRTRGTGLGLSLVRDVVFAHKGRVRADSTPGAGSVFTVSLPAARDVENGESS